MSRRASKKASSSTIPMARPDRSGPNPSRETLLDIAEKRGLLKEQSNAVNKLVKDEPLEVSIGRLAESILWSSSLAMFHFMFDVLAQHQYAEDIIWSDVVVRGLQAFGVFLLLFYILHPHASPSMLTPRIPPHINQAIFFTSSVATGCYLIYITNEYGYYAVMKQTPPLGCMWIWSVIELDLIWAVASLLCCIGFLKYGKYSYL